MDRGRVQVDPDIRAQHDFIEKQVRQPGCQRPLGTSRKRAVEVAPVRQVPRVMHEAERIDDRHRDQRASERVEVGGAQQPPHDLHADHFIAMDSRTDEHGRPRPHAVDNVCGKRNRGVVGQDADRQFHRLARTWRDARPADHKWSWLSHQPLPFVLVLPGFAWLARKSTIRPAMSIPVAFSTPSRPGDEFTSITTGP